MSRFISNKSCEMCHKIETGLTEMRIGKTNHYICYHCAANFIFDALEFAALNLRREFNNDGYDIIVTMDGGIEVSKKEVKNE